MNLRNQIAQDVIAQASWLKPFWLKRRILFQFNIFLLIPLSFSMRPGVCFEEPSQRDSIPGTKSYKQLAPKPRIDTKQREQRDLDWKARFDP